MDLELVTNTAQEIGFSLPIATITQQIYRAANNIGFSDDDYTAILAFIQRINRMEKGWKIKMKINIKKLSLCIS